VHFGEQTIYPALLFPFDSVTVVAWQYFRSLEPDRAAVVWAIRGTNGVLPHGVPLTARWHDLHGAYGRGIGNTSFGVDITFCRLPGFYFDLEADPDSVGPIWAGDFTQIPDTAKLLQVSIMLDKLPEC
jgi:hypothetical protein